MLDKVDKAETEAANVDREPSANRTVNCECACQCVGTHTYFCQLLDILGLELLGHFANSLAMPTPGL